MPFFTAIILFLFGISTVAAQQAAAPAEGFAPLFNGRDLTGWVEMGEPGAFVVEDGTLFLEQPQNYPNWLRTESEYENFILRLEYLMAGWCETGIFIQAPLYGNLSDTGLKIHLKHERSNQGSRSTGGIYDVLAPITIANHPQGEWNALEVSMNWPRLRVTLNGTVVQDVNLESSEDLRWRRRRGYLGFDDLNCRIRYRNIQIRTLPDRERSWTSLFNGRDLTGWEIQGDAHWTVEDGKIVSADGDGFLITRDSFGPFEFETYFRTTPHANGGVFYRWTEERRGYEIQIYNVPGATNPTGSIYGRVGARELPCRDGDWCLLRFISDGAHTRVWVNGRRVAESFSLTLPDGGRVALQMHSRGRIEYLNPRIRALE